MSVVVNRSTKIYSRLVFCLCILVLFCVGLLFVNFFAVRSARSRLSLERAISQDEFFAHVDALVNSFLSTNKVPVRVPSDSPAAVVSSSPSFRSVDLSTWETVAGVPRACLDGVYCGVGDYCEYGLIISIRPRRVICQGSSGLIILASKNSPSSPPAAPTSPAPSEQLGEEVVF